MYSFPIENHIWLGKHPTYLIYYKLFGRLLLFVREDPNVIRRASSPHMVVGKSNRSVRPQPYKEHFQPPTVVLSPVHGNKKPRKL